MEDLDKLGISKASSVFYTNGKTEVTKSLSDAGQKSLGRKLPKEPVKNKQDSKSLSIFKDSKNTRKDAKRVRKESAKTTKLSTSSRTNSSSNESETSSIRKDSLGSRPFVMHVDSAPIADHLIDNNSLGSPRNPEGQSKQVNVSFDGTTSPVSPGPPNNGVKYLGGYRPECDDLGEHGEYQQCTEELRHSEPHLASIVMAEIPQPLTPESLYVVNSSNVVHPEALRQDKRGNTNSFSSSQSPVMRRRTYAASNKSMFNTQSTPGTSHLVGNKLKKMAVVSPLTGVSRSHTYTTGMLTFDPTDPESERLDQVG